MNAATMPPVPAEALDIPGLRLGVDPTPVRLQRRDDVRAVAAALAQQARRELSLLTLDLEPAVFDQPAFLDAVARLARRNHTLCLRVLLVDSQRVAAHGHRLIELSRRLGSAIQFRRPPEDFQVTGQTYLLSDAVGYLVRPLASRYEGMASFNDPGEAARLERGFREVWERSEADSELRLLRI